MAQNSDDRKSRPQQKPTSDSNILGKKKKKKATSEIPVVGKIATSKSLVLCRNQRQIVQSFAKR